MSEAKRQRLDYYLLVDLDRHVSGYAEDMATYLFGAYTEYGDIGPWMHDPVPQTRDALGRIIDLSMPDSPIPMMLVMNTEGDFKEYYDTEETPGVEEGENLYSNYRTVVFEFTDILSPDELEAIKIRLNHFGQMMSAYKGQPDPVRVLGMRERIVEVVENSSIIHHTLESAS